MLYTWVEAKALGPGPGIIVDQTWGAAMPAVNVDQGKVRALYERETQRFHLDRPESDRLLQKAKEHMPNGVPCAWMDGLYFHHPIFARRSVSN